MKTFKNIAISYLLTFAAGILLTIFHSKAQVFNWIIIVIGVLFLLPSTLTIINVLTTPGYDKKEPTHKIKRPWFMMIPGVGGFILGILLISIPDFFQAYLIYTFGISMIICGLFQLFSLMSEMRLLHINPLFLILPGLTFLVGLFVVILGPEKVESIVTLLTGIVLICYSLNGFIGHLHRQSRLRQHQLLNISLSDDIESHKQ